MFIGFRGGVLNGLGFIEVAYGFWLEFGSFVFLPKFWALYMLRLFRT